MGKGRKKNGKTDKTGGCIVSLLLALFVILLSAAISESSFLFLLFFLLFFLLLPFLMFKKAMEDGKDTVYVAMVGVISAVMNADGKNTKSELKEVKAFLLKRFSEKRARKMLLLLKEKLQTEIRNIRPLCLQINRDFSYSQKLEFLTLLFRIPESNDEICRYEATIITQIAHYMRIDNSDFDELTHRFSTFYNYRKRETSVIYEDKSWAYELLSINKSASQEEIKKAYRRLAMQHHPDKVAPLGSDAQAQAAEKFRRINEAYKHLKERK